MPRLYKKEKLCSATAIDTLFRRGGADFARLAYPLRMMARNNPQRRSDASVAFLISVPKKRLRHAVDRVLMRRRVREAYRLHRDEYALTPGLRLDVVFIYVANECIDYARVEAAMRRLLGALQQQFNHDDESSC